MRLAASGMRTRPSSSFACSSGVDRSGRGAVDRLGDLQADGERRIERRHRLLEDHRDAVAAIARIRRRPAEQVLRRRTIDLAAIDLSRRRRDQPDQRERGDALAGAGFPDDRDRFASPDLERHLVDRRHLPRSVLNRVVRLRTCEKRLGHTRCFSGLLCDHPGEASRRRFRHRERSEAIQGVTRCSGLLRFARNDGMGLTEAPQMPHLLLQLLVEPDAGVDRAGPHRAGAQFAAVVLHPRPPGGVQ